MGSLGHQISLSEWHLDLKLCLLPKLPTAINFPKLSPWSPAGALSTPLNISVFLVHSLKELIRNLRLNTNLNIYELSRNKLSISRNWKTGHSIPNSYMKFSYALCNVLSHIKDKTIKGSFSLFCFLTRIRSISIEKNVRFQVLAVAVRENVWEPLKLGLISG